MTDLAGTELKTALLARARELGLDALAVTHPSAIGKAGDRLRAFLADGRHGDMGWMAANADRRADPTDLWPEVRTVIMVGQSYAPARDPLAALAHKSRAAISVYAQGRDYHDVLKAKIKILAHGLADRTGEHVKVFVDTAPLMEKPLAAAAGLGWQGKHTNLVSREHGSWLFLGAILTTAQLPPDEPEADHCGSCRKCLDVCPTNAFPKPYQLDARRCLAYLSIEHKGHIALEFRRPMGNRVFGCDDCLAVCPWNKFAAQSREQQFNARPGTDNLTLAELLALDEAAFRTRFAGTPVKRTGRDRVLRNALIAAGNSDDPQLLSDVDTHINDPNPIVRAMAAWAYSNLAKVDELAVRRQFALKSERDDVVISEWNREPTGAAQ